VSHIRVQVAAQCSAEDLGRYHLLATLGQGGMGTIHLAVAGGLGDFRKLLVVKQLRQDLASDHRFVAMFMNEAQLAARLNHPNVVQTLEAGREGDRYFLSMEFLDGQPLSAILRQPEKTSGVPLGMRLQILCDALAGLHYAHELTEYDGTKLQIVHRDVSPQNIFVTYDGQVKVVDFGIAKAIVTDTATTGKHFKGKFGYAAPEQVRGAAVDSRTDVFAVGVILWEAVTSRRFAEGKPTRASVQARLAGLESRLTPAMPDVDPLLAEICDRALSVDPERRFATAEEFRTALAKYLIVSGQQVDTATMRHVMCAKFADERKAIHRLIDDHIKQSDGAIVELGEAEIGLGRETGNDNPTTVADISKLVSDPYGRLVTSMTPPVAPAFWRSRLAMGCGSALLAFALAFGYGKLSPESPESITVTSSLPQAAGEESSTSASTEPPSASKSAILRPEPLEFYPKRIERVADKSTERANHGGPADQKQGSGDAMQSSARRATSGTKSAASVPRSTSNTRKDEAVAKSTAAAPTRREATRELARREATRELARRKAAVEPESSIGADLNRLGKLNKQRPIDLSFE
jgi:serine/threonine protein kinase